MLHNETSINLPFNLITQFDLNDIVEVENLYSFRRSMNTFKNSSSTYTGNSSLNYHLHSTSLTTVEILNS